MPEDDPEASYRRGYHHGALAAVEAAEKLTGNRAALRALRKWVEVSLDRWRYRDRIADRDVPPPPPPV